MIVDSGHVRTDGETMEMINFTHDLCKGKLVVDSGARRSVAGLRVVEDYCEYSHQKLGNAECDFQPTLSIQSSEEHGTSCGGIQRSRNL